MLGFVVGEKGKSLRRKQFAYAGSPARVDQPSKLVLRVPMAGDHPSGLGAALKGARTTRLSGAATPQKSL